MSMFTFKRHSSLLSVFLILLFTTCVTTGPTGLYAPTIPNAPFAGNPNPSILDDLAHKNPLLVDELGKIPDLQGGISSDEERTLEKLLEFYNENPNGFDKVFEKMHQIGIPEVRKYCSPLQALFWLLKDAKMDLAKESIENYELKWLLLPAWSGKRKERWGDYDTVIERLNAPDLINIYQRSRLSYSTDKGSRLGRPTKLFALERGDCRDYTAFSVHCLRKAGYEAQAIKVECRRPLKCNAFHVVCGYKENGKEYIMDNTCTHCGSGFGITEKEIYLKRYPQIGYGYLHGSY